MWITDHRRRWIVAIAALLLCEVPAYASEDCDLSAKRQVAAATAFRKLARIFYEPRCVNCHGAVNPFSPDGGHGGGYVDIREETREFLAQPGFESQVVTRDDPAAKAQAIANLRRIANSPAPINDNDYIRANAPEVMKPVCEQCHVEDWRIPMRENLFAGRTVLQLCEHIKASVETSPPDRFLGHIASDRLIQHSFIGRRGLTGASDAQPPSISHAAFEGLATQWVDAMNSRFPPPPSCGCKFDGILLSVYHRMANDPGNDHFKAGYAIFDGEVAFEVVLKPDPQFEGWLLGEVEIERPFKVSHVTDKCAGQGTRSEFWEFRAQVDEEAQIMKLQFDATPADEQAEWTCKVGPYSLTDPLTITMHSEFHQAELPLASDPQQGDEPLQLNRSSRGGWIREWLDLSLSNYEKTDTR